MRPADVVRFAWQSLWSARVRSLLSLLAMAIGVAAVSVLTWLGEGARGYVADQFHALGSNLVIVLPGRNETVGGLPPVLSAIPRDLTIDDALAVARIPAVRLVAPLAFGTAPVSFAGKERESPILGTTEEMHEVRHLTVALGRFLGGFDPHRGAGTCVVGSKVRAELFGAGNPIGRPVRIGDRRFRVIGALQPMGASLGANIDECVFVPVADALALFNRPSLFRILAQVRSRDAIPEATREIVRVLKHRHAGEEDVTVITQDAVMATFDRVFRVLTFSVAGIAMISLLVAGILIMNVMVISVTQRTAEIGLLKAIGARARDVRTVFLFEAGMLSLLGALAGVAIGQLVTTLGGDLYPALGRTVPGYAIWASVGIALGTGLCFGVLPATRAARLDPVLALARR